MLRRIVELTALLFEAGGTFAMSIGAVVALGLALRVEIELERRWPWQGGRREETVQTEAR